MGADFMGNAAYAAAGNAVSGVGFNECNLMATFLKTHGQVGEDAGGGRSGARAILI